jgi:hypothetical protein
MGVQYIANNERGMQAISFVRDDKGAGRNAGMTLGITCLASGVEAYLQPGPSQVRAGRGYCLLWAVRTVRSTSGFRFQSFYGDSC